MEWHLNPMNASNANLKTIDSLRNRYDCDVGYSGHESGLAVSFAAVGHQITSLERHITLDRASYGSDQSASLEPRGMQLLIKTIKTMQVAEGEDKIGIILDEEIPIAKKLREHIKT